VKYKEDKGPSWWTAPRVIRVIALTLSAAGVGVGVWKHIEANNKQSDLKDTGEAAEAAWSDRDKVKYDNLKKDYDSDKKSLRDLENQRNIFAISAGALGAIGMVSFFF
jgi:hypothetical protein